MADGPRNDDKDMENQTEFDLSTAIQQWRECLKQSPQFRAENLDELETHLHDSTATLRGKGLSDQEAFLVATRRIGSATTLGQEFSKINANEIWLSRVLWMLLGVQLWGLINNIASALSTLTGSLMIVELKSLHYPFEAGGRSLLGSAISTTAYLLPNLVAIVAVTAGCWWLIRRNEQRLSGLLLRRSWIVLAFVLLGASMVARIAAEYARSVMLVNLGAETYGKVAVSFSVTNLLVLLLQIVVLALLTVWIARRQVRLAPAPRSRSS